MTKAKANTQSQENPEVLTRQDADKRNRITHLLDLADSYALFDDEQPHAKTLRRILEKVDNSNEDYLTDDLLTKLEDIARKILTNKKIGLHYCSNGVDQLNKARVMLGIPVKYSVYFSYTGDITTNKIPTGEDFFMTVTDKEGNVIVDRVHPGVLNRNA